jgi:hypothetical protein
MESAALVGMERLMAGIVSIIDGGDCAWPRDIEGDQVTRIGNNHAVLIYHGGVDIYMRSSYTGQAKPPGDVHGKLFGMKVFNPAAVSKYKPARS